MLVSVNENKYDLTYTYTVIENRCNKKGNSKVCLCFDSPGSLYNPNRAELRRRLTSDESFWIAYILMQVEG